MSKLTWYWHVHHETLLEPTGAMTYAGSFKNRRRRIREKGESEVPTRLRLFRRVNGKLPAAFVKRIGEIASDVFIYGGTVRKEGKPYAKQILALHKRECKNCPWKSRRPNSLYGTIFPKGRK